MKRWVVAALAAMLSGAAAIAIAPLAAQDAEPSKTLLPGKGAALTMAKCAICHDITHVTRTRLSRDEWEDNLKVMIARGMPIEPHEIPIVIDYLATYYNRDKPPPPPDAAGEKLAAGEATPERLASELGCVACHAPDKRVIGPSFREIAERYKAEGAAAPQLASRVKGGSSGVWGQVPMPPHPQLAEADLQRVIAWILQR